MTSCLPSSMIRMRRLHGSGASWPILRRTCRASSFCSHSWRPISARTDYALELLRRVFIELRQCAPVLNVWHPVFADVRKLPGFKDLVRDYGIYDYWRESGKWGDFARPIGADDFEVFR